MPDENNNLVQENDEQPKIVDASAQPLEQANSSNQLELETLSRFRRFVGFIKKHKISLFVTAGVLIIIAALFIFIPVIGVGDNQLVNVNTAVKLKKGQTAKLKVRDVTVKIVNFTNDVCPTGQKCFGADKKAVEYILTENGKGYANGSETPAVGSDYKIETISSDYETYAEIKIVKQKQSESQD